MWFPNNAELIKNNKMSNRSFRILKCFNEKVAQNACLWNNSSNAIKMPVIEDILTTLSFIDKTRF